MGGLYILDEQKLPTQICFRLSALQVDMQAGDRPDTAENTSSLYCAKKFLFVLEFQESY